MLPHHQLPVLLALPLLALSTFCIAIAMQPLSPTEIALMVMLVTCITWLISAWGYSRHQQKRINEIRESQQIAALSDVAAGVGHEVNNSLIFISGNLSELADDLETYNTFIRVLDSASDSLEIRSPCYQKALMAYQSLGIADIYRAAPVRVNECIQGIHHIERVINDVKELSRCNTIELQLGNINTNINAVIDIVRARLPDNVSLQTALIKPPKMLCHPPRFAQVVLNILMNGVYALNDKEGTLSVRQYQTEDIFYTEITDDGCGMSSDVQARMFEPFFTTRAEGKGAGLGLALSHKIMEEHRGTIIVDSRPGEGARLTLALPVRNGE